MFKIVKYFYSKGYYANKDVGVFVKSGSLTAEQYREITGEVFA